MVRIFGRLTGLALDTQLKPSDIGRLIYSVQKVGKRKFSGLELPEFLKGVAITGKVQGNELQILKYPIKHLTGYLVIILLAETIMKQFTNLLKIS